MDPKLIFAKTPIGDEAVRQSTRVVQRSLRMVLVQVDGKLTVAELSAKIGDPRLVEGALRELEEGGYIAPTLEAVSVWQESKLRVERLKAAAASSVAFGTRSAPGDSRQDASMASSFSTFGRSRPPAGGPDANGDDPATERNERGARRSPLTIVAIALVSVLLIAVAILLFFPYERFKPGIESELVRTWQTPVRVGNVQLKLLPKPGLLLSDIRIGERGDSVIEQVRIYSLFSMLGSGAHILERVEIAGGRVLADHLAGLSILTPEAGRAPAQALIRHATIERITVVAGPLALGELNGDIKFHGSGQVEKAALQTVDRTLRMEVEPGGQGPLMKVEGLGWRPTDEFPLTFDSLQAQAVLQKGKLTVQSFDSRTLGGVLRGSWLLDWSRGLTMAGDAKLERLDCRKVTALFAPSLALEGDLMGSLRLRGAGSNWQAMWGSAEAALDAVVVRGVLNGVDLGEAARRGNGSLVRAGSTKFDRLAVRVSIDPRQVIGRDLTLNAGMFTAAGQFVANRERQVDSNLLVTMQTSVSSLTLPIRVSGTLPNLQAASTR